MSDHNALEKEKIRRLLMAKALGFVVSIEKQASEERARVPSFGFAEDYNTLLRLVASKFVDVRQYLPPSVTFRQIDTSSDQFPMATYGEILTYAEQIIQLLKADGAP